MNKYLYSLLLICLVSLVGCSARELEFDRTYPDTSKLAPMKQANPVISSDEVVKKVIETKPKPRTLFLLDKNKGIMLDAISYCWRENIEECAKILPTHPYDDMNNTLANYTTMSNAMVEFSMEASKSDVPPPNLIEIYSYDKDKNLVLYDTVAMKDDGYSFAFKAPSDVNAYVFIMKALFTEEIQGVAYYSLLLGTK